MIKNVFSDVDSTLIFNNQGICEKNLEAIDRLRKAGGNFVICSGRLPCAVSDLVEELKMSEFHDRFIVCGNGSVIIDSDFNIIDDDHISSDDFKLLLDFLLTKNVRIVFATFDNYYLVKSNNDQPYWDFSDPISYDEALDVVKREFPYKFIYSYDSFKEGNELGEEIKELTNGRLSYVHATDGEIEVINSSVSKGRALKRVCELSSCSLDECLAIGDNGNDLEMLKVAGVSACPSNAVDYVKEVVDYVSPVHCKDGAVGEIIERFVFNG